MLLAGEFDDNSGDLCRITRLVSPISLKALNVCADRRVIFRQENRDIRIRAIAPVGSHAAGFQGTYFHPERRNLKSNGLRETAHCPFRSMISSTSRSCEPTADG